MNRFLIPLFVLCTSFGTGVLAQSPPAPIPAAAAAPKTLAATLKVYVFPSKGQNAELQSADEAKCYAWAVETTGIDPFLVQKQAEAGMQQAAAQQAAAQQAGKGSRVGGAVAGAAAGALIGEIGSNDAGEGAAVGAAVGVVAGGARRRNARRQGEAQAQATAQTVQAVTEEQMGSFRKAFSVCLEAKEYLVKL
ncbi:MAG TPA: YMGG-like glycine zipper-containing protein [Thermoanaerobaculia bacterium]|nr:YMGG-like glycine zipper-containing protein [Thermoanaerobaculia bacterium]